jgi:hypothetical protein
MWRKLRRPAVGLGGIRVLIEQALGHCGERLCTTAFFVVVRVATTTV